MRKLDLAPCPFPSCASSDCYDCQSFSNMKGLIWKGSMQISYLTWNSLDLFSLSFSSQLFKQPPNTLPTPPQHTHLLAGIVPFNIQSKEWGSVLWTVATAPKAPHLPPFLQSISAHSRCRAEPKDSSDIEKYWELNLYSPHINIIRLIGAKLDDKPYYQQLLCLSLWMPIPFFCECLKDLNVVYSSQNLLRYTHCKCNSFSLCICLTDAEDTSPLLKVQFFTLHVILSPFWHRIASSVGMTAWWDDDKLTPRLICHHKEVGMVCLLPDGIAGNTASVPDKAVGVTNEAAVTLQTESQSLSQSLTLLPHGEVQRASNARCPSRSVSGRQDGAVGRRPGAVLHQNWEQRKDNIDWFSGWRFSDLQIVCRSLLTQ